MLKNQNNFNVFTKNIFMKTNNMMSGALILVVGGVLAKVFSAIYRIFLTRILGGVGIGIYQLIFPIYSLCVVLATAGLPMAISKVIAKHKGCEKTVVKKCVVCFSLVALVLALVMAFASKGLAWLQGNNIIYLCYIILAPTILFVAISSVLRGYFQGIKNFTPSAVSNIVEQFAKLLFGLVLSIILIKKSVMLAIIGAIVGIVISEVVSVVILFFNYKKSIKNSKNCNLNVSFKEITKDILPITLTNLILPFSSFIDSILVVNLLKINFSANTSVFLYGLESGAVATLISLPTIFSFAIASAIMPSMSCKENIINKNNRLNLMLKIVLVIAIPCVICFIFFPNKLIEVLYGNRLVGFGLDGNAIASKLLVLSSFGVVGLTLNQVYSTSLQAINYRRITIKNLTVAVFIKFIIQLLFMPFKSLNIYALAVANTVCYLLVFYLNNNQINKVFKINLKAKFWGKIFVCNAIMLLFMLGLFMFGEGTIYSISAFVVGMLVYIASLFFLQVLDKKDLATFKYGVK